MSVPRNFLPVSSKVVPTSIATIAFVSVLTSAPGDAKANAYDMVINGVEAGGGSIRIHDQAMQSTVVAQDAALRYVLLPGIYGLVELCSKHELQQPWRHPRRRLHV